MSTLTVNITPTQLQYDLIIEEGIAFSSTFIDICKKFNSKIVIIIDSNVHAIYRDRLTDFFHQHHLKVKIIICPAGEENKTRAIKEAIENEMQACGFSTDTLVVAIGGGVTSDIAGFIAATYCRGVPLIICPTSLLAMVDACLGGKNGVNTPHGKNLIGTFYQPKAILIDPLFLKTLPPEEWLNGLVEMIKHALIFDKVYLDFLKTNADALMQLDSKLLAKAIFRSCQIKQQILEKDEQDTGMRRLLNFGHTIGHAIEFCSEYQISHGRAVAAGIILESRIAHVLGYLPEKDLSIIENIFDAFGISNLLDFAISSGELWSAMTRDKKSASGNPRIVMLSSLGHAEVFGGAYCTSMDADMFHRVMQDVCV